MLNLSMGLPDLPQSLKETFEVAEDGTIIVPFDWYRKYRRLYSVYYEGDMNKPLYEAYVNPWDGRIDQNPWIAVTPLRYARITRQYEDYQEIEIGRVEKERVRVLEIYLTADEERYWIRNPAMCYMLTYINELFEKTRNASYDLIEAYLEPRLKRLSRRKRIPLFELKMDTAWFVSVFIGLGFLDIDYQL